MKTVTALGMYLLYAWMVLGMAVLGWAVVVFALHQLAGVPVVAALLAGLPVGLVAGGVTLRNPDLS